MIKENLENLERLDGLDAMDNPEKAENAESVDNAETAEQIKKEPWQNDGTADEKAMTWIWNQLMGETSKGDTLEFAALVKQIPGGEERLYAGLLKDWSGKLKAVVPAMYDQFEDYTGEVAFDASADSSSDWEQVVSEITEKASPLTDLVSGDGVGKCSAVSLTAQVKEFESKANGKKNALILDVPEYDGTVKVQIGSIYSGTDVRDLQSVKNFESFTNQTEWSQYAKALNAELDAQVVAPLALDESVTGKSVTLVGAASESGGEITITPVTMSVE